MQAYSQNHVSTMCKHIFWLSEALSCNCRLAKYDIIFNSFGVSGTFTGVSGKVSQKGNRTIVKIRWCDLESVLVMR